MYYTPPTNSRDESFANKDCSYAKDWCFVGNHVMSKTENFSIYVLLIITKLGWNLGRTKTIIDGYSTTGDFRIVVRACILLVHSFYHGNEANMYCGEDIFGVVRSAIIMTKRVLPISCRTTASFVYLAELAVTTRRRRLCHQKRNIKTNFTEARTNSWVA